MTFKIFAFSFFISFTLFSQQPYYRHYTVNDGLASSTVYKIIQDKKGFIWIATENGAQRFDGKTFKTFSKENGLLDNSILDLFEDSRGRIWFLSLSGQIAYWDNGIIHNTLNDSILKKVDAKTVLHSIAEDKYGNIYITSSNCLYLLSGNRVFLNKNYLIGNRYLWSENDTVLSIGSGKEIDSDKKNIIYSIFYKNNRYHFVDSKTAIYKFINLSENKFLGTSFKKLFFMSFKNKDFEYKELPFKGDISINNLSKSITPGLIWVMTKYGAILYNHQKEVIVSTFCEDQVINTVLEDKEGSIWFGTMGGDIFVFNKNKFLSLDMKDGLSDNIINDIILFKKRLWLGYNNGQIDYLQNSKIKKIYKSPDLVNWDRINHLLPSSDSSLYIANESGLFNLIPKGNISFTYKDLGIPTGIKAISQNQTGNLWISNAFGFSTSFRGIRYLFDSGRIYSLLETNQRKLWIGGMEGLKQFDANQLMKIIQYLNEKYSRITEFTELYDSTLDAKIYLRPNENMVRIFYNFKSKYNYDNTQSGLSTRINDIEESPNKTIWVATHGSGIFSIKNDTIIQQFKTDDGLSGNLCKVIKIENDSLIWVGTNKGLNKLTFSNNKLNVDIFTSANGLISNDVNAIELQNDTVWVATSGGLSFFNKNQITKNLIPPPVYISQISLNNTDTTFLPHYDLSFSQNSISINFIGLSYQLPEKVSYKYQMQGLSDEWFLTSLNIVKYDYLPEGDYKFSVYAKSPDGIWSLNSAEVSFHISPPFYQTWWFYTLSFLFISGLISFVFWYRLRQIKKQNKFKLLATEGELKALRAQMNPHFIFNSLNSIQYFISKSNNENAQKYLS